MRSRGFVKFSRHIAASGTPRKLTSDRKSTRLNSSHANISYAVFCLKQDQDVGVRVVGVGQRGQEQLPHVAGVVCEHAATKPIVAQRHCLDLLLGLVLVFFFNETATPELPPSPA